MTMTDMYEALAAADPIEEQDETALTMVIFREFAWSDDDQPAIRKLAKAILQDGYSRPRYEVAELGEDSEAWMVEGITDSTHEEIPRMEVAKWIIDTCGVSDGMADDTIPQLKDAQLTFRDDWAWVPVDPDYPDDECRLAHGDNAPANLPRFSGTLVSI